MKKNLLLILLVCSSQVFASSRKYGDELAKNLKNIKSTMPTKDDLKESLKSLATSSDCNERMNDFNKNLEKNLKDNFAQQSAAIDRQVNSNNQHSDVVRALKDVQNQLNSVRDVAQRIDTTCQRVDNKCGCIINRLKGVDSETQDAFDNPIFQCCAWFFGKDASKNN